MTDAEKLPPTKAIRLPSREFSRCGCVIGSMEDPDGTGETIRYSFCAGSALEAAVSSAVERTAEKAIILTVQDRVSSKDRKRFSLLVFIKPFLL